ncbi:alpha/beta hydrolase [Neorhizobium sp. JUb45]|uniref:alpha/beta fold hydrolase n=1 Tax=unclassified Neorhizobium TaxID=2629175 RepID=UPI0010ED0694|nr:alpha/beta hydrolase [Neorhizobium sp. JUb45]TCR06402.1 lysophospholipase [Neorhizobium sp. JUb45]
MSEAETPPFEILRSTPDNPVPPNHFAGFFTGYRGAKLRYAVFRSDISPARGTIVLLHGRSESIEKYYETIRDFNAMGLWVATYDLRGQGGSDRLLKKPKKGHLRRFSDYERDLDLFLEQIVLPDARLPFFLVAHSTGSLIALAAAPYLANRIDRMALAAPFVGLTGQAFSEGLIRLIAGSLTAIGLGQLSAGTDQNRRPFSGNPLTSDPKRFARNGAIGKEYPELEIGPPTMRWLKETLKAGRRIASQAHLTNITIPTLILAPMRDGIVPYGAQEELARNFRAGQLVNIIGGRHELFSEADIYRAQALAAIEAFIPGSDATALVSDDAAA